jgi:membrane protease YdiL (CAAX protease family)
MKLSKYSEHTKIGWYLGALAILFELSIGFSYLLPKEDRAFGIITVIEGAFALTGLLFIDVIYGKKLQLKPDYFKPSDPKTFLHTVYILGAITIFQIIIMQSPLSVRGWHRALAIMFAGPSEELFFRGLLLSPFMKGKGFGDELKIKNPFNQKKYLLEITIIQIVGIIFSSFAFTILHINYYGDRKLLVAVFGCGIILGLFYQKYKNLTANILAHFALNFIFVIQSFWLINF